VQGGFVCMCVCGGVILLSDVLFAREEAGWCLLLACRSVTKATAPTLSTPQHQPNTNTNLTRRQPSIPKPTTPNHPPNHPPNYPPTTPPITPQPPPRELASGISEIVKYGLIRDAALFAWLEANMQRLLARDTEAVAYAVERSCVNKAEVVAADEREGGVRATLNLGHTFGHAIETGCGYGTLLHGEAVSIGMVMAADMSVRLVSRWSGLGLGLVGCCCV